jgi:hypothetical protein
VTRRRAAAVLVASLVFAGAVFGTWYACGAFVAGLLAWAGVVLVLPAVLERSASRGVFPRR